jgi:hypothetical protein
MLNKEQLQKKATDMNAFLQSEYDNEPAVLLKRMEQMEILISQSGEYLSQAKYYQDEIVNGAVMDSLKRSLEDRLSATTINLYVKTAAKEYNYIVNQLDRINAAATHQHGGLRTRISFIKSTFN